MLAMTVVVLVNEEAAVGQLHQMCKIHDYFDLK
jgi:hypothetical protein